MNLQRFIKFYRVRCAIVLSGFVAVSAGWAQPHPNTVTEQVRQLTQILEQPAQEIDLAKTKLTIDKMIDPRIDIDAGLKKIDAMVAEIKALLPENPTSLDKIQAVRTYLYQAGSWNQGQPYQYDLDDPLGTKLGNKLLPHYIKTKKGNCISMPFLFIILGDRLGLDVTASTIPFHVFVMYRDSDTDTIYNLETTNGAHFTRDAWYREQTTITDTAIASGIYLRPLTRKETVAVMIDTTLGDYYFNRRAFKDMITLSDFVLAYHPKNVPAMLRKGSAYSGLLHQTFRQYKSKDEIPMNQRFYFEHLLNSNKRLFAQAETLGWREANRDDKEKYLQTVKQEIQFQQLKERGN